MIWCCAHEERTDVFSIRYSRITTSSLKSEQERVSADRLHTVAYSVDNSTANFTLPSLIAAKSTAALATAHANSSWCTDPVNSWVTKCSCSELLSAQESTSTVFYTYQEGTSTVTGSLFEIYQNGPTWEMPMDCCYDCEIFATEVSLLYWPVDEDARNASVVNASTPYTLISDGFT